MNDILSKCICVCLKVFPINQCCQRHCVMVPMETHEKRKRLLIHPLEMPPEKAEAILKTYENFIYGDVYYTINSHCINVLK
jgi:hypothetical protein